VGGRVPDGKLDYFSTFWEKGSLSEYFNITKSDVAHLPGDADPVRVAGLLNPGISSWMAIKARTSNLPPNFFVLGRNINIRCNSLVVCKKPRSRKSY
jgi:hypothetical protein